MAQEESLWNKIYNGIAKRRGLEQPTNDVVAFGDSPVRAKLAPEDQYAIQTDETTGRPITPGFMSNPTANETAPVGTDWAAMADKYGGAAAGAVNSGISGYLANQNDYNSNMAEHEYLKNKSVMANAGIADRTEKPGKIEHSGPWQVMMGTLEQIEADKQKAADEALTKDYMQTNKNSAEKYQAYLDSLIKQNTATQAAPPTAATVAPPPTPQSKIPIKKTGKNKTSSIPDFLKPSEKGYYKPFNEAIKGK